MRLVPLPLVQISVSEGHEPPVHGEEEPGADEGGGEDDDGEAPPQVHQRGKHVLKKPALFPNILVRQVTRTVLGDEARLVYAVPKHGLAGHP